MHPPTGNRREVQARQTRHEILRAARQLIASKGYASTSVVEVARLAGVSVQTIYDSVGSKAALVSQLNDQLDEEGEVAAIAGRIPTLEDPEELLMVPVKISRNINERCGDIVGAVYSGAASEPELQRVRAESMRRHRAGVSRVCRRLQDLGSLRRGLDLSEATDVVSALTSPQVARTFALDHGWSWDIWESWTFAALGRLILEEPG